MGEKHKPNRAFYFMGNTVRNTTQCFAKLIRPPSYVRFQFLRSAVQLNVDSQSPSSHRPFPSLPFFSVYLALDAIVQSRKTKANNAWS